MGRVPCPPELLASWGKGETGGCRVPISLRTPALVRDFWPFPTPHNRHRRSLRACRNSALGGRWHVPLSHAPIHTHSHPLGPAWVLSTPPLLPRCQRRGLVSWSDEPLQRQRWGQGAALALRFGEQRGKALGKRATGDVAVQWHHWPWAEEGSSALLQWNRICGFPLCQFLPMLWAAVSLGTRSLLCFLPWRGCHLILRKAHSVPGIHQFCLKQKVKVTPEKIPAKPCELLGTEVPRVPKDPLQHIRCPSCAKKRLGQEGPCCPFSALLPPLPAPKERTSMPA